jgi:hypothetical protein
MIKRIVFIGFLMSMFLQFSHGQGKALIYELKMGFSADTVRNVSMLTVSVKMKRIEMLTSLEIELGSVDNKWDLLTKTISIVNEEGNYYLVGDNIKQLMYGPSATVQFIVPNDIPAKSKFAKVFGKQLLSEASNVLYYQF